MALWFVFFTHILFCKIIINKTTDEMENDSDDLCRALAQVTAGTIQQSLGNGGSAARNDD